MDIYLPFTGGYVLAESGKVTLNFRYSENLDFERSLITVYWGTVPVASKKLTKANAGGDELSFTLPEDVFGTYAGNISIAFDLELQDLFCTPRMDQMPWAYVTGDSMFYLPVGTESALSFDNIPYPFELSSYFNKLMIVIPDNISLVELDALGQIVSLYGVNLEPYSEVEVVKASEFSADNADYNIILIGNYSNNSVVSDLNENLSFQYSEDGNRFLSNNQLVLSDKYASDITSMQLIYSPYAEDKAILAVCGINDNTMEYVRDYLEKDINVWKLNKDSILIDCNGEIKSYQFLQRNSNISTPNLMQFIENNKDTLIFTVVATSAMLILLLVVILILIRMYGARKKSDK